MKQQVLPKGLTHERIKKIIAHYDSLTDEEWAAEDEAAFNDPRMTRMFVPTELVPAIAGLIAEHEEKASRARKRRTTKPRSRKKRKATG